MATVAHEGVEFLDPVVAAPGVGAFDDPGAGGPGAPRPRARAVLLAVVVTAGLLVAARALGAPPPTPPAAAAELPVQAGQVALPPAFGTPVQFATAAARGDDVVWALGDSGQLVRIVDGVVTARSSARGYHAVAVRPDGRGVFVTTGHFAPTVVALDPVTLEPHGFVLADAPVTALAVGVGSVWAASSAGVQGWTTDLQRELRAMRLPDEVIAVRSLHIVGARLQALVMTAPGTSALLRLEPPGGGPRLSSAFAGPVSIVPGIPTLVAHVGLRGTVEIAVDPSEPGSARLNRPFPADASVWPAGGVGTAGWLVSTRTSPTLDCFDGTGAVVGRMTVGVAGRGVAGPVTTTPRAVYAVTVDGALGRGGHASCGVAPRASSGGRRG